VIITYINHFSRHSCIVDHLFTFLAQSHLLKGTVLVTIMWGVTFKDNERQSHNRERIIITSISCFVAMVLARLLALTLPFRLRPLHEKSLHFLLPYGMSPTSLEHWSSFPSDHAVLFFSLSTGLLLISRKAGIFALFYTAMFICFPRIYLGLHYPTDIIAGAVIGMTIVLLSNIYLIKSTWLQSIANWSYSKPHLFFPVFFLLTYQIADMFEDIRSLVSEVVKLFGITLPS